MNFLNEVDLLNNYNLIFYMCLLYFISVCHNMTPFHYVFESARFHYVHYLFVKCFDFHVLPLSHETN